MANQQECTTDHKCSHNGDDDDVAEDENEQPQDIVFAGHAVEQAEKPCPCPETAYQHTNVRQNK